MKSLFFLLTAAGIASSPLVFAEDTVPDDASMTSLCETYAQEDHITADKKPDYIAKCLANMTTGLSENLREDLPVVLDTDGDAATATPSSEKVNQNPDDLVKDEVVETPDPNAEQLNATK